MKQWEISRHILNYKQLINSLFHLINSLIKVMTLSKSRILFLTECVCVCVQRERGLGRERGS